MEPNDLVRKKPYFVQIFPARETRDAPLHAVALLKPDGEAAIRILEIAASNGVITRDMPQQIARIDFLPLAIYLRPAPSSRDEFHALVVFLKLRRNRMAAGALVKMRNGVQLACFFGAESPMA